MLNFARSKTVNSQPENILHNQSPFKSNFFANLLRDGYHLRVQVTGKSMMPFIKSGSFVTLSRTPVANLCIGDIVLCQCNDGSLMLHRLIRKKGDMLLTKGDALFALDAPFHLSAYKGRAIRVELTDPHVICSQDMDKLFMRFHNFLIAKYFYFKLALINIYRRLRLLKTRLASPPLRFF